MTLTLAGAADWLAARPLHHKLLLAAALVVAIELLLRRAAPRSPVYRAWTRFFEGIGHVWTAVLLGVIYFVSVSLVSIGMRLGRHDPLDRSLSPEPSFWRPHQPSLADPQQASRHQF